jgi:hypothetical protein
VKLKDVDFQVYPSIGWVSKGPKMETREKKAKRRGKKGETILSHGEYSKPS